MGVTAIILAAGRGTRMASYSNVGPKSLLEFKGQPLLARQLESSSLNAGIKDFIIVGGYMVEKMQCFINESKFNIQLLHNPFYANMNSIGSLWFAREHLSGDVFITNGDTYFSCEIYSRS